MTENFPFLFHYLKKEKITIDQTEFLFQVQSHASYPSLLAISDTLNFLKISNLATRLESEDLVHLPNTFVALIQEKVDNPFLAFVERKENGFQYSKEGKSNIVSNKKFEGMFQNIVLLAEKEENELVSKKSNNLLVFSLVFLGLIYLFLVFATGFSLLTFLFVCFATVGVYLSVEAISHEFGIQTKFSEAVCTITTNSDCDAVINAKKSRFLENFSFSEASITFFSAQLLGLLLFAIANQLNSFYNITLVLLLFSIPITLFSFYQQIVVAKKWCPICLVIICIIYAEIVSLLIYTNFSFAINTMAIAYFLLVLIGSHIASVFLKSIVKRNLNFKAIISENNRFKRKYSLFKMALLASDVVNNKIITSNNIFLGNPEAKLKITVVSSPFCGHCKEMHKIIEEILDLHKDKVCFDLHFNFDVSKNNEKSKIVHQKLVQIYFNEGQDVFAKALHDWFENKEEDKLLLKSTSKITDLKTNEILNQQFSWNQENKITYTPAIIINNHLFPYEYDRNDLIYFINDLEDDAL
ncbi:vitamin K epoxide reductase family protein [Flavobacterium sp.]|uniref:vitamin K epoxide reductase family protein n=1 Tax=Flavobacterium sp. TaxID=239 RepID=UPI00374CD6B9